MLRGIICLHYNVIVFQSLLRGKVIIEKYLKFANEVADSNNNPHHLRYFMCIAL